MTFQTFTAREYLKIDIANNFGLDKLNWNDRIAWFNENEGNLHALVSEAEEPALFYAGVRAYEQALAGEVVRYPISLDATASGIQVLAALACDRQAAALCNVIDTGQREDAYTGIYTAMVEKLGERGQIERKATKNAIMTAFYTSTRIPKKVFGEGELLRLFWDTLAEKAPGAWEITQTMLALWNPTWLEYGWILPDNFHARMKVKGKMTETVHFLNAPYEVEYKVQMPIEGGRALGANLVHSIDGMMCREMGRRCMYDPQKVEQIMFWLTDQNTFLDRCKGGEDDKMVMLLWSHYLESGFLSARILDHLKPSNMGHVSLTPILMLVQSLPKKPFEILMVHDCFRVLPAYGNDLRRQYNNLLAEIAESELLSFMVSQIMMKRVHLNKIDPTLSDDIRQTNYALS